MPLRLWCERGEDGESEKRSAIVVYNGRHGGAAEEDAVQQRPRECVKFVSTLNVVQYKNEYTAE